MRIQDQPIAQKIIPILQLIFRSHIKPLKATHGRSNHGRIHCDFYQCRLSLSVLQILVVYWLHSNGTACLALTLYTHQPMYLYLHMHNCMVEVCRTITYQSLHHKKYITSLTPWHVQNFNEVRLNSDINLETIRTMSCDVVS